MKLTASCTHAAERPGRPRSKKPAPCFRTTHAHGQRDDLEGQLVKCVYETRSFVLLKSAMVIVVKDG